MVVTWQLVVLTLALICFFLAAIGVNVPRVNLLALGLFLWLLVTIWNACGK